MYLFIIFIFFISPVWAEPSFTEQLDAFNLKLYKIKPSANYVLNAINSEYPKALLVDESLLPQTENYPLSDLMLLYKASEKCQGPWPVNPVLTDPLVFSRSMCFKTALPSIWFSRSNLIHPGGGSYASRYIHKNKEKKAGLEKYTHIKERALAGEFTLLGRLQRMSTQSILALNNGAKFILSNKELWLLKNGKYHVYSVDAWMPLLTEHKLQALPVEKEELFCLSQIGNVCWNQNQVPSYWFQLIIVLIVINLFWIGGWRLNRWAVKRRLIQERMLILQILTHELRTPIASLAMTVEGFRRKFDILPPPLHDEFRRLCEDAMRLKQLAEASKDYLLSNQQELVREYIPSLNEWMCYFCAERDVQFQTQSDAPVAVNIYWLSTSLDNLISNAKKYGHAPVKVFAEIRHDLLLIRVEDQGTLTEKDWKTIRKPFVSKKGLGLGLTIVESMIKRMGGTLTLKGPPTTFILEIPCDPSNFITGRR